MSLSGQVGLLATRVGAECKSIRNSFVPNTLRGPIGGITASTGVTGTVTIDPALSNHRRLTATGDVTIGLMAAGADGQRILFEVNASAGQRILTFDPGYELSASVPVRSFTIPSGSWAYVAVIYRNSTWRLVSAEPQATPDYSTPSAWVPADHGLLAWTADPVLANASITVSTGALTTSAIKVSTSNICTNVTYAINTAGAGFTTNRNYIGLWNASGSLIAQTADLAATWNTTGVKTTPWAASVSLSPGTYFAGFISTSSTGTTFSATAIGPILTAVGRSANSYRGGVTTATYTALPATRPASTANVNIMWFGLG